MGDGWTTGCGHRPSDRLELFEKRFDASRDGGTPPGPVRIAPGRPVAACYSRAPSPGSTGVVASKFTARWWGRKSPSRVVDPASFSAGRRKPTKYTEFVVQTLFRSGCKLNSEPNQHVTWFSALSGSRKCVERSTLVPNIMQRQ